MRFLIYTILFTFLLTSCQSSIEGEGPATETQEYAVDFFEELNVDCNCDLTLIPSEDTKVVIETHENIIENLDIDSKKKKLNITEKSNVKKYSLYNVNVYFNPELTQINLNNNTKMKFSGTLKADKMAFDLRDNASIYDTYVDLKEMELDISGNSQVSFNGTAIDQKINATNDARADLSELQAVDIDFKAKKDAALTVYAMKKLSGKATDNAVVYYLGDPKKNTTEKDRAIIQKK